MNVSLIAHVAKPVPTLMARMSVGVTRDVL